jgi:hypothetical protein
MRLEQTCRAYLSLQANKKCEIYNVILQQNDEKKDETFCNHPIKHHQAEDHAF